MADIKTKDIKPKSIKAIDKTTAWTERIKDPIVYANEKVKDATDDEVDIVDYGDDKIKYYSNRIKDESVYASKKAANKGVEQVKKQYQKKKLIKEKTKEVTKDTVKKAEKGIKTGKKTVKNAEKVVKESAKASKRMLEQGRKLAIEGTKKAVQGTKALIKATISAIKAIIAGVKSLVAMLAAGGSLAAIAIVIICLVGLLVTSIFGIFFSSEKTSKNGITMKDVVMECNQEFSNKLDSIQASNPHDEYVLDGNMASWKDILLIYSIKQSNGKNEQEVITIDNNKKQIVKNIFWDMNEITSEVKMETYKASKVNINDMTKDEQKRVLHIYIKSKTAEEMKIKYNFNALQLKQYNELSSDKYSNLWSGAIYGYIGSGEFVEWRQTDPKWASIKVGNSTGTLGSIGCLITSISILIEKSGCNTLIKPFNPGTFLEKLNEVNSFDGNGNLQYAGVTRAVPAFKYVGNVNLRGKSREEKLSLIKQYQNNGYYITAEVKGATPGNQHWIAVINVEGNNVLMVDPGGSQTIMWNAYNYEKTSQFNYFKVE